MYYNTSFNPGFDVATAASTGADMTTTKRRAARNWASVGISSHILVTMH
jgi:hypothetical protein